MYKGCDAKQPLQTIKQSKKSIRTKEHKNKRRVNNNMDQIAAKRSWLDYYQKIETISKSIGLNKILATEQVTVSFLRKSQKFAGRNLQVRG